MYTLRLNITPAIEQKLKDKHGVKRSEIEECFLNREGDYLLDTKEEHATDPPTLWFISTTDIGRVLKVIFIDDPVSGITIKSAFNPNNKDIKLYDQHYK